MSKYFLVLLSFILAVFCFLNFVPSAYAQSPTPTPTWEPLFYFPTSTPVRDYCPVGSTPSGWGTVTPSPRWLLHCSKCLVSPTPTSSFPILTDIPPILPTSTPTVVPTDFVPTATPLPSVTPTSLPYSYGGSYVIDVDRDSGWLTNPNNWYLINDGCPQGYPYGDIVYGYVFPNLHLVAGTSITVQVWGETPGWEGYPGNLESEVVVYLDDTVNPQLSSAYPTQGVAYLIGTPFTLYYPGNPEQEFDQLRVRLRRTGCDACYQFRVDRIRLVVNWSPDYPNPQSRSYCEDVEPRQEEDDYSMLPVFRVSPRDPSKCILLGDWNINLSWASNVFSSLGIDFPSSFYVPSIGFCLRSISFGKVTVISQVVDLDFISVLISVVLAIRLLFRS